MTVEVSPGDLAKVNVVHRVQADAVWSYELSWFRSVPHVAYSGKSFPIGVHDCDSWADVGYVAAGVHTPTEFTNVNILIIRNKEGARPVEVVPLGLVFAIGIEHLHPVVFPVRYIYISVLVGGDIVWNIEFAWVGAWAAP